MLFGIMSYIVVVVFLWHVGAFQPGNLSHTVDPASEELVCHVHVCVSVMSALDDFVLLVSGL